MKCSRRHLETRLAHLAHKPPSRQTPLALLMPMPEAERINSSLTLLSALESIARGTHPGRADWDAITDVVNIVDTLAVDGRITLPQAVIDEAECAMADAARRYRGGKPLRLSGPGMQAVRDVLAIWLECLGIMTRHEIGTAKARTHDRIRAAIASGTVRVVDMPREQP